LRKLKNVHKNIKTQLFTCKVIAMILSQYYKLGSLFAIAMLCIACQSNRSPQIPTSPPQVVATFLTAELTGTLVEGEGCLRVNTAPQSYGLVFPPDASMTHNSERVTITLGLVTNTPREVRLRFGERVKVSGGETDALPSSLAETVTEACIAPYWVVGASIERVR
jgi:hypothetical protein